MASVEEKISRIVRVLRRFLAELKDIRGRIVALEKRIDILKARVDTLEAQRAGGEREVPEELSHLFKVDVELEETPTEREARVSLLEVVESYERYRELEKTMKEMFG